MILHRRFLVSVTLLAFLGSVANAREWSDATGKFKTEAELVKVEAGKVFLKKRSDGATIQVEIARLSAPDQEYLKSLESPGAELTAAGSATASATAFALHTAGCVGLMVVDPKPVFQQAALNQPPLKDLVEKGVVQAGIDFRKLDRVTAYFIKPDVQNAMASKETNAVAVAEFSSPVDPAAMLSKIPTTYEAMKVAGKACHKPAAPPNPWVCVIDEKTLAFAADEKSLTTVLSATTDDADLAKLLGGIDPKNEVRYVLNLVPMKDLFAQTQAALPPDAAKMMEVVKEINSFQLTTDLDGSPSIELLLQAGDESKVGEIEKAIKDGLAELPKMVQAAQDAARQAGAKQPPAGASPMDPAMMGQMLGGMSEKINETLAFEQAGSALKISVKFPANSPPLVQSMVQMAGFFAMMSQQSGAGGASGPKKP